MSEPARIDRHERLPEAVSDAVAAIVARATDADGTAPISEEAVHAITSEHGGTHLVAVDGDTVVGYANVTPDGAMAEAVVDPERRGAGVGTALVERALADPATSVWAHGQLPGAVAVAQRLGLTAVRELLQLRRSVSADAEPLPQLTIPDGIDVRTYREGDDAEILRVNNAAFAWHPEQGGWTQADIDRRRAEDWFDPQGLFVATDPRDPGTILGFHWTKVHPPEGGDPSLGEVYVVGVDPAAQGRGLGRTLTLAGLHHLQRRGLPAVLLYVEADNGVAVHTYEKLGFTRYHVDVAYARR